MTVHEIFRQFIDDLGHTTWLEYIAVITGIASVWYSRKENILVYPVGIISTVIYIYISLKGHLFGEASVNFYYTVASIYGWIIWAKKDTANHYVLRITGSNAKGWKFQVLFFAFFYVSIFVSLTYLKKEFAPGAIPWADAFASATAYTGMWLMARKKVESWYWWIATNISSIPLYFVKVNRLSAVMYTRKPAFQGSFLKV